VRGSSTKPDGEEIDIANLLPRIPSIQNFMQVETISVIWEAEFGSKLVRINQVDFDPKIHRRPQADHPLSSVIPIDFPGALSLKEAGITELSQLGGKTEDDLTAIKGIGKATAKQIIARLLAMQFTET
jgi:hypothetical protein